MATHQYLGFRTLSGEYLKRVAEQDGSWLALLGWGHRRLQVLAPRSLDRLDPESAAALVALIANNMHFLIPPGPQRPRRCWRPTRAGCRGTGRRSSATRSCWQKPSSILTLRAPTTGRLGFQELGQTQGYRRDGGRYHFRGQPKTMGSDRCSGGVEKGWRPPSLPRPPVRTYHLPAFELLP